jgi:hypothetical protein
MRRVLAIVLWLLVAALPCAQRSHDLGATFVEPASTAQPHTDPATITVYVTGTGAKYHRDGCRYLSRSKIPMSRKGVPSPKFTVVEPSGFVVTANTRPVGPEVASEVTRRQRRPSTVTLTTGLLLLIARPQAFDVAE